MTSETDTLRHQCREAERQEHEAQTKLNVLTSYFKEKEVELQKGLGELETERKKSMNNLESSDRQQKMLELELENKKQLVDDLKKEIERIESDYRKQVSVERLPQAGQCRERRQCRADCMRERILLDQLLPCLVSVMRLFVSWFIVDFCQ